jgi:hypothetical protein
MFGPFNDRPRHETAAAVQSRAGRVRTVFACLLPALTVVLLALPSAAAAHGRDPRARLLVHSDPSSLSVRQGHSTRSRLRVTLRNGSARRVSFRVVNRPRGVRASFRPSVVKPGHVATLTLTTFASTRVGAYRMRVVATSVPTRRHHHRRVTARLADARVSPGNARITHRAISLTVHVFAGRAAGGSAPSGGKASTTSSGGPVPDHVETWSYDDNCNGGVGASQSLVRSWLSYAESNCGAGNARALSDCHQAGTTYCTAIQYLDANMIYSSESVPVASDAQESWWVHQPGYSDAAHRLTFDNSFGTADLLDQSNTSVQAWFQNYVHSNYNSFDGLMMDDTSASQSEQFYGSGSSSSEELTSDSAIVSEHEQMAAAMTHGDGSPFMQVDNGLSVNPWTTPAFSLLNNGGVSGLIAEGDPIDNGTLTGYYSTLLDDMSYIDHTPSDFLVLLSYDPSGSLQARRIQAATVLLGYSPGHIVSWSDLEQDNHDLQVFPEEGIYPTNPVQTMAAPSGNGCLHGNGQLCTSGGHTDLQVAPGVYRREFHDCYDQGTSFGNCAVIVNDTGNPVTIQSSWLTLNYTHQITLNGGDVQTGGTINTNGNNYTPGNTTIPANDATLLSP